MKTIVNYSDTGIKYLEIKNMDGKIWLVPFSSVSKGLELYQPSSKKGQFLKKYLCAFKYFTFIIRKFGIRTVQIQIDSDFMHSMKNLFNKADIQYSIFLGTPGRDNKPTIQLYTANEILAFCKFSATPRICDSFRKEAKCLTYLGEKGVHAIPKVLSLEKLDKEESVFIQSTEKAFGATTLHHITDLHIAFLRDLADKTCQNCKYIETDYYKSLCKFKDNHNKIPFIYDKNFIENVIQFISARMEGIQEYSFYHGDFTPWNTYLTEKNTLEVFDFEYAKYTYPKLLDIFHFFTQIKLYESNENADEIMEDFKIYFVHGKLGSLFENVYFSYLLYLVDIMNFYLERDYGYFSEETVKCLKIRYELMIRCFTACLEGRKT
jgi:hypothetical protein